MMNIQLLIGKKKISEKTYEIGENSKYLPSKVRIYAPMVDTRMVDKVAYGDWFAGIAPFKTEYMFVTKGIMPKDELRYRLTMQNLSQKSRSILNRLSRTILVDVKDPSYKVD